MSDASLPSFPTARASNGRPRGAPLFFLALLAGLGVHAAALVLLRVGLEPARPIPLPPPFVSYRAAQGGESAHDEALTMVLDPEPVFLQTAKNFSARALQDPTAHPPSVFSPYAANVTLPDTDFRLASDASGQPGTPREALRPQPWNFMLTLGRAPDHAQPLESRGARLKVMRMESGANPAAAPTVVANITWPAALAPASGNTLWSPANYSLLFGPTGMVGEPLLVSSSGNDTVDEDLSKKLHDWFTRHTLPPGSYEVVIGP
jgi:hypothetical protein